MKYFDGYDSKETCQPGRNHFAIAMFKTGADKSILVCLPYPFVFHFLRVIFPVNNTNKKTEGNQTIELTFIIIDRGLLNTIFSRFLKTSVLSL